MLIAEQLSKAFDGPDGRITVLDGADLSLAPGARLGLVGPSGCGKSPRQAADPRLTLQQTILEPLAIHRELPAGAGEQWDLTVAWAARMAAPDARA
ncbi:MAG: hypothetical protein ACRDRK_06450 [Pseudonocardia sp.]